MRVRLNPHSCAMAHRKFTDSLGRSWDVWTVVPSRPQRRRAGASAPPPIGERRKQNDYRAVLDERWAGGWLTFETKGEKRRLSPFPEGWATMPDEELEQLCRHAIPVQPSRRLIE